jgi:ATP-binding cassette subfamily C protein CydD
VNLDRRLLLAARRVHIPLALAVGCAWLAGLLLVAQAWLLSQVVAQVFLDGRGLSDVAGQMAALLVLSLGRSGLVWSHQVAAQHVAGAVKSDLRARLVDHLLFLGPAYTRAERSGELTATALEGVEALDAYFGQYLPQLITAVLVPLTVLAVIVPLDLISAIIMLVTAPLIPFFMILIGGHAEQITRRQWTALRRMSAHFLDVLQGLTTLKLVGRSRHQIESIARISNLYRETTMAVLRVTFLSAFMLELLATLSTAVVAVEVGLRLLYGNLTFHSAFFVLILAPEFYMPLRLLGARFHAGISGATAAQRLFEVLETPPQTRIAAAPVPHPPAPAASEPHPPAPAASEPHPPAPAASEPHPPAPSPRSGEGEIPPLHFVERGLGGEVPPIRFQDVHYAYGDGERPALNGVSFEVTPGSRVALVGPSGGGKSTVIQLLLRFIAPQHGAILIGDCRLDALDVSAWRSQLAWVPQLPYLFHTTVADNIRLGRPEASLEQVIDAARRAHAHDFIVALPDGYETPVGERGARLSGGQAQRIALARAFLKDTPLLILDEATSQLDPVHETLIQQSIAELVAGRTVVLVAHRLRTARDADQILVIADGRIAESGTHTALLSRDGLYRRLVEANDNINDNISKSRNDSWRP